MRFRLTTIALVFLLSIPSQAVANPKVIDPEALANARLRKHSTVEYIRYETEEEEVCRWVPGRPGACAIGNEEQTTTDDELKILCSEIRCNKQKTRKPVRYQDFARVDKSTLKLSVSFSFDDPVGKNVSSNAIVSEHIAPNCVAKGAKGSPARFSKTISFTKQDTWNFNLTNTLSKAQTTRVDAKFTPSKYFSFGVGKSYNSTIRLSQSKTEGKSQSISRTENVSQMVQPGELLRVQVIYIERIYEIPFTAKIKMSGGLKPNLSGVRKMSDILPQEDLEFELKGKLIADVGSSSIQQKSFTRLLRPDECKSDGGHSKTSAPKYVIEIPNLTSVPAAKFLDFSKTRRSFWQSDGYLYTPNPKTAPGDQCYNAACNFPYDGYRYTCFRDDENYCLDCYDVYDPVCDVEEPPEEEDVTDSE